MASPATVVWLVSLLPAFAYLVVGGFPATSGLQRAMRGQVGLWLLVLSGAVLLLLQVRRSRTTLRRVAAPWSNENIMLDTRNLSPGDLAQLRAAVQAAIERGELPLRVLWWP